MSISSRADKYVRRDGSAPDRDQLEAKEEFRLEYTQIMERRLADLQDELDMIRANRDELRDTIRRNQMIQGLDLGTVERLGGRSLMELLTYNDILEGDNDRLRTELEAAHKYRFIPYFVAGLAGAIVAAFLNLK